MKHLSKLTPAETIIMLHGPEAKQSDLLKYTFMDLLLKRVLAIKEISFQANASESVRMLKYVTVGRNFFEHRTRIHERAVLSVFQINRDAEVLFRNLVRISFQNAGTAQAFRTQVMSEQSGIIRKSFLDWIKGSFSFTEKGELTQSEVRNELAEAEQRITASMAADKTDARELMNSIGGNVLLLSTVSVELLREFDKEVAEAASENTDVDYVGLGCWGGLHTYSNTFDSADTTTDGDHSGCGSDSGCSGCGGCGGD